ncbi:uncharacterized protein LOC125704464 isoform X2 [Brienomyrus brachyistius]|uniref:uncharacterized protein LOC125704464 isoform X2 n=1 Tax=Brienomyrus brachyistius TaxID=42636 RepID=UPI0020B354E8|nr:uncharacterized protein LOC125704464 isoform X2 [Brienomyrus brachyistius]
MEADSRKPLEVAALGRPFQLGMLYDCRDDCLIPGITLWDREGLHQDTNEIMQPKTEFDVIASDSVEDKAWALNVGASLKASFLGGLVEIDGSANYLKDTKASKKQARVTLKYKTTTKFMQLSMSHLGRGNVKHSYLFEQGIATHVVTAVLYGAQAFFVFDREVSETENQQNIKGNLHVMIKKIPKLSIEGEASLELTDTDRATEEKLSCKFYGDFALKQTPVSFQDAVKIYTTLPGLLGEKGENAVPVRVWLLPLEILDSSAARLVRQISVRLINETQSVIEDFSEIEMQCNDIMKRKVISYFPEIGRKVKSFKDMCLEYKSVFQRSLSSILPSIRGGGTEECVLANILTKKEESPFNSNKLKEWLDCKEQEINLLQTYTDMMEDTKILASKSELQSEILKNRDKHVVCFALTSLGEEEPYLSCLQSHLKALSTAKLREPTEEDGKDVEPSEFYLSDAVSEKINKQVFLFMDFAKANKENKKTHFISASIPNDKYKGASIYLYTDGMKQSDQFEPPSKPERPNASDVTHDSVTIKLNHPQYGSSEITHYLVEYCANESDDWQFFEVSKSNLECTVSGLLPHTGYRFRYKAVCPAGVSLASEAESIKTLPTSPPGKAEKIDVDLEEIEVTWTKPDMVGNGVSIENYIVEYRTETNENETDWEKKTSKGEVYKMTGLQPDTAYYIRITCNCGESGQSKESLTVSISTLSGTTTIPEQIKQKSECLSLEEKYAQWSWKLRKYSLETPTKLINQIGSNKILYVNTTDLISDFDNVYTALKSDIEAHFKDDKRAEILIEWNVEKLEKLKNELIEETLKQCKILIKNKRSMSEVDQKKYYFEAKLMQKSKTMASLKDKRLTDKQVEEEFRSLWVKWVAEIAKDQLPDKPVNIKVIVEKILYSHFQKQADIMNKIKTISENGMFEFTKKKHISQSFMAAKWESIRELHGMGIFQGFPEKLHRNVNHMVNEYIKNKELEKTDFNRNFIFEILDEVERHIQECERNENVKFTYEYRVDLSVSICLSSVQRFQKMHESFKKANDPVTYLQSKKKQYSEMFTQYCKGANSVRIFAEFLFKNILPAVEEAVYNQIKLQIINTMKCNNPAFSGNRCNLENHILRHLTIQKKFEFYKEYIDDPKSYFKRFIGEHVEIFCKNYKKLQEMLHENLQEMKLHILRTSTEASEEVNLKNGNASMWLDHFCKKLGGHMVMNRKSLTSIQDEDISDTKFLKEMMAKYLEEVVKSEHMESVDASSQHLRLLKQKITEILFKQLEGCWAQCPFCKAICTNTLVNHSGDHSVHFHRSSAMGHFSYYNTDEFSIDFCSTNVSSDCSFRHHASGKWIPYKSYRDAGDPYDKWSITADGSTQGYWKWFICRFQKEWEDTRGYKFKGRGAIPNSWRKITEESVLEELNIRD